MPTATQIAVADEANFHLIGVFLLLLLTGFYVHVFIDSITAMLRRRSARDVQPWWLVATTVFLFLDLLVDIVIILIRTYQGLRVNPDGTTPASNYFMDQSSAIAIIPDVCLIIGMLLTDGIMVYRTYVVWGCRFAVVALPCLIWIGNTATVVWVIIGLASTPATSAVLVYLAAVLTRVTVTAVLTFTLNVLCASLITWKILREASGDSGAGKLSPNKVVEVIVQSAGIWCAALLVFIITAAVRTPVFFIVLDCMMPVMTTVFSLIIVRLWRQSSSSRSHPSGAVSDLRFSSGSRSRSGATPQLTTVEIDIEMPVRGFERDADGYGDHSDVESGRGAWRPSDDWRARSTGDEKET